MYIPATSADRPGDLQTVPPEPSNASRTGSSDLETPLFQSAPSQGGVNLFNYRTPESNLLGLQPDQQGIYSRTNSNGNTSYFTRIEGNTYQVGNFQMQEGNRPTWGLMNPRTGGEVLRLENEGGAWRAMESVRAPKQYAATPEGRIAFANDDGIKKIERAITRLHEPWDPRTTDAMVRLYGQGILAPEGKGAVEQQLLKTLNAVKHSRDTNGADESVAWNGIDGTDAAGVSRQNGRIEFSGWAVQNENTRDFTELNIHEHSHKGAGSKDQWYQYSPEAARRSNYDRQQAPFTFNNAVNNADTLTLSVRVLTDSGAFRPAGLYSAPPEPGYAPRTERREPALSKQRPVGQSLQDRLEFKQYEPGKADDWAVEGAELLRLVQEHASQARPHTADSGRLRTPNAVAGAVAGLYALTHGAPAPAALWHQQAINSHAAGSQAAAALLGRTAESSHQQPVSDDLRQDRLEIRRLVSGGLPRATARNMPEQDTMHALKMGRRDARDTEAHRHELQHLESNARPRERQAISDLAHGRGQLSRTETPTRSQPQAELGLER